jgi:hypothetical protein
MLSLFKQSTSTPLSGFVLQMPQHKADPPSNSLPLDGEKEQGPWRSPRLMKKNSSGKDIFKLAQDLIAKKCGVLKEEVLDRMTLQQYLDLYKQPLNEQAMDAIIKLTEVASEKDIKKKKKQKKAARLIRRRCKIMQSCQKCRQ